MPAAAVLSAACADSRRPVAEGRGYVDRVVIGCGGEVILQPNLLYSPVASS